MTDFLWHKVSEKEKGEIEKQAKEIMDGFSNALKDLTPKGVPPDMQDGIFGGKNISESVIELEEYEREESSVQVPEISREIMFENAPEKNKDFIVGERKRW